MCKSYFCYRAQFEFTNLKPIHNEGVNYLVTAFNFKVLRKI